jgi:hypothetical protein
MNTKAVITSLVTAGIIAMVSAVASNYSDIGRIEERDISTEAALERIEKKVDNIHRFLIKKKDVILK